MKEISKSYLSRKINKLNKKIHRAEDQSDENKIWWRKMKLEKLKNKLKKLVNMSSVLSKGDAIEKMNLLSKNWVLDDIYLTGSYTFKNFDNTFAFMKEVAVKCEEMNHHPKWTNVYNKLDVELYTHDEGGITEKDFELSSFMDATFQKYN